MKGKRYEEVQDHCSLVGFPLGTEQVVSSIPGSVEYIFHVHWAYDYLGPFGVLWVHMAWHKNFVVITESRVI